MSEHQIIKKKREHRDTDKDTDEKGYGQVQRARQVLMTRCCHHGRRQRVVVAEDGANGLRPSASRGSQRACGLSHRPDYLTGSLVYAFLFTIPLPPSTVIALRPHGPSTMAASQVRIFVARLDRNLRMHGLTYPVVIDPSLLILDFIGVVQATFSHLRLVSPDEIHILKLNRPVPRERRSPRLKAAAERKDSARLQTVREETGPEETDAQTAPGETDAQTAPEETGPGSLAELVESMRRQGLDPDTDPNDYDYVTNLDLMDVVGECFGTDISAENVYAIVLYPAPPGEPGTGEWCAFRPSDVPLMLPCSRQTQDKPLE